MEYTETGQGMITLDILNSFKQTDQIFFKREIANKVYWWWYN